MAKATRTGALMMAALLLASCADMAAFFQGGARGGPYQAGDYVRHLSVASLALVKDPPNAALARPHLEALEGYGTRRGKKKPGAQRIVIIALEYKGCGGSRQAAVPVANSKSAKPSFPGMRDVMGALKDASCTLYNVRSATVSVSPPPPLRLSGASAQQVRDTVDHQLESILASADKLPPQEDVRIQMELARFFMQNRMRDGAYLAIENAKYALAAMPKNKALSRELEALEKRIHETMPFTL